MQHPSGSVGDGIANAIVQKVDRRRNSDNELPLIVESFYSVVKILCIWQDITYAQFFVLVQAGYKDVLDEISSSKLVLRQTF